MNLELWLMNNNLSTVPLFKDDLFLFNNNPFFENKRSEAIDVI